MGAKRWIGGCGVSLQCRRRWRWENGWSRTEEIEEVVSLIMAGVVAMELVVLKKTAKKAQRLDEK
jgi:hypothetical protein